MDHLIDDVARVLASPMSRRSAVQHAARLIFGAAFGLTAARAVGAQAPYSCGDNVRTGSSVGNCTAGCNSGNAPDVTGNCPAGCPTKTVVAAPGGTTACAGEPARACFDPCPVASQSCSRSVVRCRCGTSVCGENQCCCVSTLSCVTSANANGGACTPGQTAGCST